LGPELFDPFRSLLQFCQMSAWILISKLKIRDHGKPISQRLRKDNIILVHGCKVSPGRGCIQGVSRLGNRFGGSAYWRIGVLGDQGDLWKTAH
jgi:hypothetical protein